MEIGKLRYEQLARLLLAIESDDSVIVGPAVGEDAAAVRLGDKALILTTDPITFATDLIGCYAVHVSANDVATMGAEPRWFMFTLILDVGATEELVERVFSQVRNACKELGIALVGGHTETTDGIDRPIVVGSMIGLVEADRVVRTAGARPGDAIILAGYAGVEGTAILAREAPTELRASGVSAEAIGRARDFLFTPGISIVRAARAVLQAGQPTAMHDPTEGGVAGGLLELAMASDTGLRVDRMKIKTLPETDEIVQAVGLNPLGLISSGSLLITTHPDLADRTLSAMEGAGITASVIGETLPKENGLVMMSDSGPADLPRFERDEIARFFGNLKSNTR